MLSSATSVGGDATRLSMEVRLLSRIQYLQESQPEPVVGFAHYGLVVTMEESDLKSGENRFKQLAQVGIGDT